MLLGIGAVLSGTDDDIRFVHSDHSTLTNEENLPGGTEYLGSGAYGVVVQDTFMDENEQQTPAAVKIIRIQKQMARKLQAHHQGVYPEDDHGILTPEDDDEYDHKHVRQEIQCLRILINSEHVVKLIGTFWGPSRYEYSIIMRAEDTNLNRWIKTLSNNRFQRIKDVFRQIMLGLRDIHYANLIHRDIKPGNVLMTGDHARICDFGMSVIDDSRRKKTRDYVVTTTYRAPEIARGDTRYTKTVDIWSAGCILYEMLFDGRELFTVERCRRTEDENAKLVKIHRLFFSSPKIRNTKVKVPRKCPSEFKPVFKYVLSACLQRKIHRTKTAEHLALRLL